MRVAYLTGAYPAVSHTFVAREIAALRARGVDVSTFSLHRADESQLLTAEDRAEAARTRNLQPPDWPQVLTAHLLALARHPLAYLRTLVLSQRLSAGGLRMGLWQLFYFGEAIVLWRWLRAAELKHVHVHFANASSMVALLYAEFARDGGATFSFTMHGPTEFDQVVRFRLREKVERATFVACISHYARSQLMRFTAPEHWNRLAIVRCGVDPELWRPATTSDPEPGLRLLTVARLSPDKGLALLVQAIAELTRRGVKVEAQVVGDGPQREQLEDLARRSGVADRVRFLGAVGQDHIRDLYEAADAFCLTSFAEGVPVVLMEAMAMARPVVAPRIMGIPELVEDGVSGVLFEPGRQAAIEEAIERLAADPASRQRMGAAGRERVCDEFDVRRSAATLEGLLAGC